MANTIISFGNIKRRASENDNLNNLSAVQKIKWNIQNSVKQYSLQ